MKLLIYLVAFLCLFGKAHATGTAGLRYNYYEGTWNSLPDFNSLTPLKSGTSSNVDLSVSNRSSSYAFLWQGFITIPTSGDYTFETNSDDGSQLFINNSSTPLINNDGVHAPWTVSGTLHLEAGVYPIRLSFFQNSGGQTMDVYWSSNKGLARQKISDDALSTGTTGLNYWYYEGSWSSLPDFNNLTPVKTGNSANIDLNVRSTEVSYGMMWQGLITIPASGNYTFELNSDDGSRLYIGNTQAPVVDNDGVHAPWPVTGTQYYEAGVYPIKILFFQNGGGQKMEMYWSSNTGIARQPIPDNAFLGNAPETSSVTSTITAAEISGSRNFYFSSSSGDDSRNEAQAQNVNTPWRSLNKLNSYFPNFQPGDVIHFKRGETFDGSIVAAKSGTAGTPITFATYGSGNKPVINGLTTLTSWTQVGTNLYEASLSGNERVNMLTVNGVVKALGRYPDSSYLTIDSRTELAEGPAYTYHGTFTDAQLPTASTNWAGAEVVIRKNEFILDRCLITSHSGTTISYNSPSSTAPAPGYGYFIQNSPLTLDRPNEWYYNPATKKLRIYSTVNPSTLVIKAGTVKTLVSIDNKTNLTFDNISFEGADTSAFNISNGSSYINIQNCNFNYSGIEVLRGTAVNHVNFVGNTTNNTSSYAIIMYGCSDITVKNNSIINTGMLAGMGLSNQQGYGAIYIQGPNTLIEGNYVDSVGQSAVAFNGGNNLICRNNFISNFCRTVGDGGGIYTNGNDGFVGKKIIGNIVSNGYGSNGGTTSPVPRAANGIYIDEGGSNVEVSDNTVFNCVSNGIYIHQSHELVVRRNTVYNNAGSQLSIVDDQSYADRVRNLTVNNNILFAKNASQFVLYNASTSDDLMQFGTYDSNYYARPFDLGGIIRTQYKVPNGEVNASFDLSAWSYKFNGRDNHSTTGSPIARYAVSNGGVNKVSNGTFDVNVNGVLPDANTTITLDKKLDGNAARFSANSASIPDIGALINLGSAVAGKSYRIRFSLIGSTNSQNLISYVRRFNDPDYSIVSESKCFPLRTTRTECEYLYTATANEPDVKLTIIASGLLLPFWIDNVEVIPVDASFNNLDDSIRFEYNNTSTLRSIALNGTYTDVQNNTYSNTISLKPYTSMILFKSKNITVNQSPVAKAGTDISITLPVSTVTLNGAASLDADGQLQSFAWTKLAGPSSYAINTPDKAATVINNLVEGVYSFKLTVTDNGGASSFDTIGVNVLPKVMKAPVANAGADTTIKLPTNMIALNGSSSADSDGTIRTYAWKKVVGPTQFTIGNPAAVSPVISNMVLGTYSFQLTITDDDGLTASDLVVVRVVPKPLQAPVARAGSDLTITLPTNTATLNGSSSFDTDGSVKSYTWKKVAGPATFTISNPAAANTAVSNMLQGTYSFQLSITDNDGLSALDTVTISVLPQPNKAPVARAGADITITLPASSVTLTGNTSTDADGTIKIYNWTKLTGPSQYTIVSPSSANTKVNYLVGGVYTFRLNVIDNAGASGSDTVTVNVITKTTVSATASINTSYMNINSSENLTSETANAKELVVYPNPVASMVNTRFSSPSTGKITMKIYNLNGTTVQWAAYEKTNVTFEKAVNVTALRPGVYYLECKSNDGGTIVKSFVKQ